MKIVGVRLPDAGVLAFFIGGDMAEITPGMVLVPRDEAEFAGAGIEINVVILAIDQESVVGGKQDVSGEEAREFLEIEEFRKTAGEFIIRGVGDQAGEIDHALLLLGGGFGFEIVNGFVSFPIVAEIFEKIVSDGVEDRRV